LARDQNGAYGVGEANEVDQLRVHGGVSGPLVRLGLLARVYSGDIGAASQLHAEAKAADKNRRLAQAETLVSLIRA